MYFDLMLSQRGMPTRSTVSTVCKVRGLLLPGRPSTVLVSMFLTASKDLIDR